MTTSFQNFRELHAQQEPLLIGNVWSVQSARVFEKLNFKAIATSSAAVAEMLGYKDGEDMPFDEYLFIVRRIKESVSLPLSVDIEGGYGESAEEIARNIMKLHAIGVAGINIEDSIVTAGKREIVTAERFAKKLKAVTEELNAAYVDIFINVRCDAFLLGLPDARQEAINRIASYDKTGVHGIFLPCITDVEDIKATTASTPLPVNVMCMPNLPDFNSLRSAGVKRISMGNFVNSILYKQLEHVIEKIGKGGSFTPLFN